jgi:hypothetical protein
MKCTLVKVSQLKKLAKQNGKRLSKDFLAALDDMVKARVVAACAVHNGGRKTVDMGVAAMIGVTRSTHIGGGNN